MRDFDSMLLKPDNRVDIEGGADESSNLDQPRTMRVQSGNSVEYANGIAGSHNYSEHLPRERWIESAPVGQREKTMQTTRCLSRTSRFILVKTNRSNGSRSDNKILSDKLAGCHRNAINFKWQLMTLLLLISSLLGPAHAGFWTFYFPNYLKPSGYNELTDLIAILDRDINSTLDAHADSKYFWKLMRNMDKIDQSSIYPEESVCSEVFPLFRDIAIEYASIDYKHYMGPMKHYRDHLVEFQKSWYPEGKKTKTILPREWEQKIHEKYLELKIQWHTQLTEGSGYKAMRTKLVNIWKSVKRSLDTSLPCIYLRYAYRQMAEDINQFALEMNLKRMRKAMEMLKDAYKRIERFSDQDERAKEDIENVLKREERLEIRE